MTDNLAVAIKSIQFTADAIVRLAKDYEPQGVQVVAISANSVETHPQDGPEKMAEDAREHSMAPSL